MCNQHPITVMQPNGGEVWPSGSVQQSWFGIARRIPAYIFGYWWQLDNFPTTQGRIKDLVARNLSITDESDANFTVQRRP